MKIKKSIKSLFAKKEYQTLKPDDDSVSEDVKQFIKGLNDAKMPNERYVRLTKNGLEVYDNGKLINRD